MRAGIRDLPSVNTPDVSQAATHTHSRGVVGRAAVSNGSPESHLSTDEVNAAA